jgi:hypothetical protein
MYSSILKEHPLLWGVCTPQGKPIFRGRLPTFCAASIGGVRTSLLPPCSWSVMLILQTEVCHLSVCWQRNKQKLSVCKQTKRTKRTCPTKSATSTSRQNDNLAATPSAASSTIHLLNIERLDVDCLNVELLNVEMFNVKWLNVKGLM